MVSLTEKVLLSWIQTERCYSIVWNYRLKCPFNTSYRIHVITGKELIAKTLVSPFGWSAEKTWEFTDPKQKLHR